MGLTRRQAFFGAGAATALSLSPRVLAQSAVNSPAATLLNEIVNLPDLEPAAKRAMTHMAYEYVAGGAGDENTLRWNREAFDQLRLRPRVLHEVSKATTETTLFGRRLPFPVLLAPTAYHRLYHSDGERGTADGAGSAGATYVVSTSTTTPIEDIARAAKAPLWFQLTIQSDLGFTRELVEKVQAAGCQAICLTVDTPSYGARNREQKAKFRLPPGLPTPYLYERNMFLRGQPVPPHPTETWKDVEWLRSFTKVPLLLKGVMTAEDARKAVAAGASGIIVSNHGGRNLDGLPATIDALPAVAEQVGGKVPILMDGGVRRGTDVVKALALGAQAVLIGRPYLFALALGGAAGVTHALNLLEQEVRMALMLLGRNSVAEVDRSVLW